GSTPLSRCTLFAPGTRAAECPPLKRNGRGASPRRSTTFECGVRNFGSKSSIPHSIASVAQCIERRASNAEVAGEIPAGSANFILTFDLRLKAEFGCTWPASLETKPVIASAGRQRYANFILQICKV